MSQVRAWSFFGKIQILIIRIFLRIISPLFKKAWKKRAQYFEENPAFFNLTDVAYLGYKYYVRSPVLCDEPTSMMFEERISQADLVIHSGGDLMPYRIMGNGRSKELWNHGGETFFQADLVMANLETPMDLSKPASWVPEVMIKNMYFNGSEELWEIFTGSSNRFDFLTIANNHMLDMGYDGLQATMDFLNSKKVKFGGVRNEENGISWISVKGYRTAIINYTYSMNAILPDPAAPVKINYLRLNRNNEQIDPLLNDIRKANEDGAELIIASLHMGNAYQDCPSVQTRNLVRSIFEESGPDIIFIHHPHVLQPMEYVKYENNNGETCQGLVFYSLGDFVAYDIYTRSHLTGYASVSVSGKGKNKKISGAFNYLYLERDQKGNFRFVPWDEVLRRNDRNEPEIEFLKYWYENRAKYFFPHATI